MKDLTDTVRFMQDVARQAASVSQEFFRNRHSMEVGFKGQADLVCKADIATEEKIWSELRRGAPGYSYMGEELGKHTGNDPDYVWFVDPIDGTTNFLSGLHYVISIALKYRGETICGVLFNPLSGEMFSAIRDHGAYLNDRRIQVSSNSNPERFVIGTGIPTQNLPFSTNAYRCLQAVREPIAGIRVLGSCANSLAHVASGRLDGFFEGPTGVVDFAVGVLLVQEAGGKVTDYWGNEEWERNLFVLAGNASVHGFLLETLDRAGVA
ncbi:MAG: inositol monophosphatase family protein [Rhodobacter sp.]|nr:inositol monophosphatase family protein [Rhodobacter sp.]MCY4168803.1 inositol monophosphatase family protein [Rhodobacter sp.]MCY4241513.1 inositol monophosphatase family protein [Rhodobacter sp.]